MVVGVTKGGKDRFLTGRASEIAKLLGAGIAVCLPDPQGAGETSPEPDWYNQCDGLMGLELALGNTLVGARLKDLRTVLTYLRNRPEIDERRIAVWGDSFAPPNLRTMFVDELEFEAGPEIQHHSEPFGAMLALVAAPRPLSMWGFVNGRNTLADAAELDQIFASVKGGSGIGNCQIATTDHPPKGRIAG